MLQLVLQLVCNVTTGLMKPCCRSGFAIHDGAQLPITASTILHCLQGGSSTLQFPLMQLLI